MRSRLSPDRIRVVVPCRNCGPYIEECLDSVLAQDFQDWTLLVADDHSDDKTEEAVRPYLADPRISYRRAPERLYLMGNTVSALSEIDPSPGDVVAILDGDDSLLPGALAAVFEKHLRGYDLVYTDIEFSDATPSIGRPLVPGVPVRRQAWCMTQLRTFKGYLLNSLDDPMFRDEAGSYFRAAGDLSLYFPLAEAAGMHKTCFIPEKLYHYRVHERCNFQRRRSEQLDNNRLIRSRPPLPPQCEWFDFEIRVNKPLKTELRELAEEIRKDHPLPYSVRISCGNGRDDGWDAYSGLWIGEGVFFEVETCSSAARTEKAA